MKIPTVHLNGTHGPDLLEQISEARAALLVAYRKLQAAAPHARDYYVQRGENPSAPDPARQATAEHVVRLTKLSEVDAELLEIGMGIRDQIDERRVRQAVLNAGGYIPQDEKDRP